MKRAEKHINKVLVSIAIFLVFGNIAFANVTISDKLIASEVSEIQTDDHRKPLVFDELSIGKVSQTVSQNEYLSTGFVGMYFSRKDFQYAHIPSVFYCSYSLTDRREILFQYLFPFHFFW